jgi:hypothetical protein
LTDSLPASQSSLLRHADTNPAGLAVVLWSTLCRAPAAHAVTFTDVTATALPGIATAPGREAIDPKYSGGGAVGDCDGDGLPDLYFTGSGHDVLYRTAATARSRTTPSQPAWARRGRCAARRSPTSTTTATSISSSPAGATRGTSST